MNRLTADGLYIVLISTHGLLRARQPELGRDADTGGQIKYVVELARTLGEHPEVARVDLLTRQVVDAKVAADYAVPVEPINEKAQVVRLPCGPRRYLRKEVLWPYLDSFADQALQYVRRVGRVPDIIHSHYADAGYVGSRLAGLLGVPLIHTGHSLGREKQRRLVDQGLEPHLIEKHYNITRRIEAEECAMDSASLVIASTRQEVDGQYALYDNYHPKRMRVIPPGTDLCDFHPPRGLLADTPIQKDIGRFLSNPRKPLILALSRADERKNISSLLRAFGENEALREKANLCLIAGNRDDITTLERGSRRVLTDILLLIDRYDLYGCVAYPKRHRPGDVPELYRLAARTRGVFVNPALTEPFGLTLIEAAASGLPVVATEDGGPRDILAHCNNGLLVDPLDTRALGEALLSALSDRKRWKVWAKRGVRGAHRHYSWDGHVSAYLKEVRRLLGTEHRSRPVRTAKSRLPTIERLLVCDIDGALSGDRRAVEELLRRIDAAPYAIGLGVATGRSMASALKALKTLRLPLPDLLITGTGSGIHYGKGLACDRQWERHIDYRWERERLMRVLAAIPGLEPQPQSEQAPHKLSYYVDPDRVPRIRDIKRHLRGLDLHANIVYSHGIFLDVLPIRAGKGQALRYVGAKWGIRPDRMLVVGTSGSDIEMLRGDTLAVVVGNHSPELRPLRGEPRIYFASGCHGRGIIEGMEHYDFLENPQPTTAEYCEA